MSATPTSPAQHRRSDKNEGYLPKIVTTVGARPACLVNASVTYVGNDQIYAFGGFDQYTDEVYNHVLRLNLQTRQWNLVDNYGDIPGVRMGHTATLWQGNKLLVFGGENEHRNHLYDVIIFDLQTAKWTQRDIRGTPPQGRARHSAVIHDDKLFILGGMSGANSYLLDDICYLDLKTWTWSRTWRFVARYDHTSWVWDGKIWVFGGIGENSEKTSDIWWLDIRGNSAFEAAMAYGTSGRGVLGKTRDANSLTWRNTLTTGNTGYAANSSSVQTNPALVSAHRPVSTPGAVSTLKFVASPNLPVQALGTHFHVFTSGQLVDFVTPASVVSSCGIGLSTLDLDTLSWHKLVDGKRMFPPNYRWQYCALNEDGTHAWLLGCPTDHVNTGDANEFLSDVLPIDLTKFGLLGNSLTHQTRAEVQKLPASDTHENSPLSGIGADLANIFDQPPDHGSGADFQIVADRECEDAYSDDASSIVAESACTQESPPIHVHSMLLRARWPHFARLYAAQMREYHTSKMHIPEPYSTVRAFLHYLYTDSIASRSQNGPSLRSVAGMLVMAKLYVMPRLRLLCINRLYKELDVEHAATIWERANAAGESWLKDRAADFCLTYWGKVVSTSGFCALSKSNLLELCAEAGHNSRVVTGEELEALGALAGIKYSGRDGRKRGAGMLVSDDGDGVENEDDENMEMS